MYIVRFGKVFRVRAFFCLSIQWGVTGGNLSIIIRPIIIIIMSLYSRSKHSLPGRHALNRIYYSSRLHSGHYF